MVTAELKQLSLDQGWQPCFSRATALLIFQLSLPCLPIADYLDQVRLEDSRQDSNKQSTGHWGPGSPTFALDGYYSMTLYSVLCVDQEGLNGIQETL